MAATVRSERARDLQGLVEIRREELGGGVQDIQDWKEEGWLWVCVGTDG